MSEVNRLRGELQQVRDDRDRLHSQIQLLTADLEKYKEANGKSVETLDNLMTQSNALEVCYLDILRLGFRPSFSSFLNVLSVHHL